MLDQGVYSTVQTCNRVKRMISCSRLDGLPGDLDGYHDSLALEPFRGETVLVIGPFALATMPHGAGLSTTVHIRIR